jgi:predicted transcriptional regulator
MDDDTGPLEKVSFLARSPARVRILEHLLDAGPATQREFGERLETSRSTIARSLGALQEHHWIEENGRTYRLTPVGEVVIGAFLGLLDTVETTDELSEFVRWFPLSDHDLNVQQLRAARVTTRSPGDPYAPARTQTELLRTADRFRGILPSVDLEGTRLVHDQVMNDDLETEIVVSPDVERTITTGEFAELFRTMVRTGRHTVLVADAIPSFYLGIGDEEIVQVGVEDDEGFPRALIESSDPAVLSWAEDVYEETWESARAMSLEAFN